ncbi:type II toxin-antitoxin system RelE/ParE family toxin [Granulicella tundricola]|uniref:Addiction module toxin, RelE/StbE family n=1 Tax=Granulicella tundricola (strain ATCC BAA-1859 / DSM 23138 / MP5ACTX9) TaxID=1198114 RepID=E8X428_GRATM|nr:type II toxin-antitoxin system RelE/ParE family toxin [Granulicella tundricola]ADW70536.1 addiction module toxin, RelE/StbE family [Granulicella tundricola MP5ACTX9]
MQLRWTPEAADNLEEIYDYYRNKSAVAAHPVIASIQAGLTQLQQFPYTGRLGIRPDTRELVLTGVPYLIVYRIRHDTVEILGIRHGARQIIQ